MLPPKTALLVFLVDGSPESHAYHFELRDFRQRRPEVPVYVVRSPMAAREPGEPLLRDRPSVVVYRGGLPVLRIPGGLRSEELDDLVA